MYIYLPCTYINMYNIYIYIFLHVHIFTCSYFYNYNVHIFAGQTVITGNRCNMDKVKKHKTVELEDR